MFSRLGEFIVRRTKLVLLGSTLAVVVAAVLGFGVFGALAGGGTSDPGSESARAMEILEDDFDAGTSNVLLLVTAQSGDVDGAIESEAALAISDRLASVEGVVDVGS